MRKPKIKRVGVILTHKHMRFRGIMMMALSFLGTSEVFKQTGDSTKALADTQFRNVNLGESPIYHPSKSQKIKRKRFLARKNH